MKSLRGGSGHQSREYEQAHATHYEAYDVRKAACLGETEERLGRAHQNIKLSISLTRCRQTRALRRRSGMIGGGHNRRESEARSATDVCTKQATS
jgi:hypothetical protein